MRLFAALGYFLALICLPCCGHSPISIEDDQELVHQSFGFAICLPESLLEAGWSIDASRKASKYDPYYRFVFFPPDSQMMTPLIVSATQGRYYRSCPAARELAEERMAVEERWLDEFYQGRPEEVVVQEHVVSAYDELDGADAVEVAGKVVARGPDALRLNLLRTVYVLSGDVLIEMRSEFDVSLEGERMNRKTVEDSQRRFQKMVDVHRRITRTLRLNP